MHGAPYPLDRLDPKGAEILAGLHGTPRVGMAVLWACALASEVSDALRRMTRREEAFVVIGVFLGQKRLDVVPSVLGARL